MGPRASALQSGDLAENLQASRKSPHERGKVSAVVAVTAVTPGTTVLLLLLPLIDTETGPSGGDRWFRRVAFRTFAALAPDYAAGASRGTGGTCRVGHI